MTQEEQTRREKKTRSVRKLAEEIHLLRSKVSNDLKSDDQKTRLTALAVALMDKTAERVGNDSSAKDGHFGVTGWQGKHVAVEGNKITLKYVGKSGVDQDKSFTDKRLAKMIKECKDRCKSGDCLLCTPDGFRIRADRVNRYLKEFGVTAKDIRGYAANSLMVKLLKGKASPDKDERKKKFQEVIKEVAARVGHQAATLRKHYLLPGLESDYVGKGKAPDVKKASVLRVDDISSRVASAERVARRYIEDMDKAQRVYNCIDEMMPAVFDAYVQVMGSLPEKLIPIMIGINDWDLPEGKVGSFKFPDTEGMPGILTVSPEAFDDEGVPYWWVTTHELIHVLLGNEDISRVHGKEFQMIADIVGIPAKYRD
jgi:DNA topoisomerase IB